MRPLRARGFCPSCGGRRMTERAAHLVDAVLPWVPVRQWVLTMPYRLRYLAGKRGRPERAPESHNGLAGLGVAWKLSSVWSAKQVVLERPGRVG